MSIPINGNLTMFCIFTLRSPSCDHNTRERERERERGASVRVPVNFAHLSEPLQVQYEDVWEGPQAQLDAALLQLLAVGAAPGVIWGQLKHKAPVKVRATTTELRTTSLTQDQTSFLYQEENITSNSNCKRA